MDDVYFLTEQQQDIKNDILKNIMNNTNDCYLISADAGTRKTLLTYDIAKSCISENNKNVLMIHCAKLNDGQKELINTYHWNIISISRITKYAIELVLKDINLIFVDEAQRINVDQLNLLLENAYLLSIPIIFSFDPKQLLNSASRTDISQLIEMHNEYKSKSYTLTKRIRTNKDMASFIDNMFTIGHSATKRNYNDISIEYFDDYESANKYVNYLEYNDWKFITFTSSDYSIDTFHDLANMSINCAHHVIGQEFDKVVLALDSSFYYKNNKLTLCSIK